ncbi:MAG: carboxypeptidase-like regulatory domain-containing protein [Pyrinomonadaceae bacterium]
MDGDERVRFCGQCDKHVYDISKLTRRQAEDLVANTQRRLCARIIRRPDGSILTADEPLRLSSFKLRAPKIVGAAFSALLSLSATPLTQSQERPPEKAAAQAPRATEQGELVRRVPTKTATLRGTVYDINKAVIVGATVTLLNNKTKVEISALSDEEGTFRFQTLEAGSYTLTIIAPGFNLFRKTDFILRAGESSHLDVTLEVGTLGDVVFVPDNNQPIVSKTLGKVSDVLALPYKAVKKLITEERP